MSATQNRAPLQRLRVSDMVLRAFEYACVMHDLKTAAMLLAILEDLSQREVRRFGGDRRQPGREVDAARERLNRMAGEHPGPRAAFAGQVRF
jgi:hypothetical protein